ncbi:ATP-binding protein [Streptomyces sp. NPDC088923]|uniref:ATP-binding protein n=1 Tax=Streptomyces sp. NPDC088923 TaxID=3365913 RepID=UPI00381FB46F
MNHEIPHQPEATHHTFRVQLSSTPRGARLARLLAVEQLREWGVGLTAPRQIIAELASNAVRHGHVNGRDFALALDLSPDTLRIEAVDTRSDKDLEPTAPPWYAESGRGLLLVAAFADDWGVEWGPVPRKTVWAEVRLRKRSQWG